MTVLHKQMPSTLNGLDKNSLDNLDKKDKEDIYNQKITKDNYKDAFKVFLVECAGELLFLFLGTTVIGLYVLLGFWLVVGIVPIGLMGYYLFKHKPL